MPILHLHIQKYSLRIIPAPSNPCCAWALSRGVLALMSAPCICQCSFFLCVSSSVSCQPSPGLCLGTSCWAGQAGSPAGVSPTRHPGREPWAPCALARLLQPSNGLALENLPRFQINPESLLVKEPMVCAHFGKSRWGSLMGTDVFPPISPPKKPKRIAGQRRPLLLN